MTHNVFSPTIPARSTIPVAQPATHSARARALFAVRTLLALIAGVAGSGAVAQPWSLPASLYSSYYSPGVKSPLSIRDPLTSPTPSWGNVESRGFASKSVLGWRPSNYYGAEIGFQPLPENLFQPFGGQSTRRHQMAMASMPVTLNAYAPLSTRTELTGRLGYLLNNGQSASPFCFDGTGRAFDCQTVPLTFGLGVRYELREQFGFRMDYDFLDTRDATFGARARSSYFRLGADYRY